VMDDETCGIHYCAVTWPHNPGAWPYCTIPTDRHSEGLNVVFADGHTKWLKASRVRDATQGVELWGHYSP
ncbi:MAG: hypothetical protein HY318_18475, partial [Armatimonadetes bacterium]|nr:hypothetical protein [Armatimonadota bacterium]